jgi:hypothetical protein
MLFLDGVYIERADGVFAPNSRHRALVTPAKLGRGNKAKLADEQPTAIVDELGAATQACFQH